MRVYHYTKLNNKAFSGYRDMQERCKSGADDVPTCTRRHVVVQCTPHVMRVKCIANGPLTTQPNKAHSVQPLPKYGKGVHTRVTPFYFFLSQIFALCIFLMFFTFSPQSPVQTSPKHFFGTRWSFQTSQEYLRAQEPLQSLASKVPSVQGTISFHKISFDSPRVLSQPSHQLFQINPPLL